MSLYGRAGRIAADGGGRCAPSGTELLVLALLGGEKPKYAMNRATKFRLFAEKTLRLAENFLSKTLLSKFSAISVESPHMLSVLSRPLADSQ